MLGLVNGKGLGNALRELRVGVVPTAVQFLEGDGVGPVTIDLVGGHVNEGRLRAMAAGGFEQVQRAHGIHVKVVEGNAGGQVVRGLRGGVDDDGRLEGLDELQDGGPVTNIEFMMGEAGQHLPQALLVPAGIALRTEEGLALVVIHAVNGKAARVEEGGDFGTDQPGRAGHKTVFTHAAPSSD